MPPKKNNSIPIGFSNVGNSCYINSTAQALWHTPVIKQWFCTASMLKSIPDAQNDQAIAFSMMQDFLLLDAEEKKRSEENILCLSNTSKTIHTSKGKLPISGSNQEDAAEFLNMLLTSIQGLVAGVDVNIPMSSEGKALTFEDIFVGVWYKSSLCISCDELRIGPEPWTTLTVPVTEKTTLLESLASLVEPESFILENMLWCNKVQSKKDHIRYNSLGKAPQALIIHLNLFQSDFATGTTSKVNRTLDIPFDLNILHPCIGMTDVKKNYELRAFVEHRGNTLNDGHYVAYVRSGSDKWFLCNDDEITNMAKEEVSATLSQNSSTDNTPYLLFYQLEC